MDDKYGSVQKLLHWLVALLVVVQVGLGATVAYAPPHDDALTARLFGTHDGIGATILALVLLRLLVRLLVGVPVLPRGTPRFVEWLAHLNHRLLYLVLIVQPLLGYFNNGAHGYPWSIYGYYTIPALIGKDEALGNLLKQAHEIGGAVLIALVALHLLGAFYHGVIRRDGVVSRIV